MSYEGVFKDGQGAGTFTFAANPEYPKALKRLGVEFEEPEEERDRELFALAIFDVSTEYIRSMRAIGYDVPLEKYMTFRIFQVDPAYVKEMGSLGFKNLSGDPAEDWMSSALTEIVGFELAAPGRLRLIPADSVARMKRELALPYRRASDEDTGLALRLRVGDAAEIDAAALRRLGFDLGVPLDSPRAWRFYRQVRARSAWLVLEQEGPAWESWRERRKLELAARPPQDYDPKNDYELSQFEQEERMGSRLMVVEAGKDAAALRRYMARAVKASGTAVNSALSPAAATTTCTASLAARPAVASSPARGPPRMPQLSTNSMSGPGASIATANRPALPAPAGMTR